MKINSLWTTIIRRPITVVSLVLSAGLLFVGLFVREQTWESSLVLGVQPIVIGLLLEALYQVDPIIRTAVRLK